MDHPRFLLYMWASQQAQYVPTLTPRQPNMGRLMLDRAAAHAREMANISTDTPDKENITWCN
jgi:hypothetical protein